MTRKNQTLVTVIIVVICLGVFSRVIEADSIVIDKYLGGTLYAALVYLLLSMVWKPQQIISKTLVSFGIMIAIEAFQLTLIPFAWSQSSNVVLQVVALLLGTRFGWFDIASYIVGIVAIALLDYYYVDKLS